jgi:PAS domain S-box-containing protein
MKYKFSNLIDIEKQQRLLDSFCDAVGIAAAIIDLKGEVLVGSRWQRICTDFHRVNKHTCKKCIESDTQLANELQQEKKFSIYQCRNGLTDAASPIIIEDKHVANVFVGQFFLKAPDREFFLRQAATYGFEETAYLDALSEVPIVTEKDLTAILNFLVISAEMVAIMGLNQLRQTKAKKALRLNEERLRVTNERLELAMDAGEHGFWDWNIDTNEMFFSPRYYTMLGYENEELPMVLETWINLMHPEDRETIVPQIQKYVENAEPYESEFRLKCKDGSWIWISGRGKSFKLDENGVSHRAVGLHVDITERKRAEVELRESEEKLRTLNRDLELRVHQRTAQLEEANKELEDFVYSVSHDLRAPLRSISGFAEIIDRRHKASLNEEGQHYFDNIIKASRQMGDLIDDLLKFSRLGRKAIKLEAVPLADVFKTAMETLSDQIKKTAARINIPEQMPVIQGDLTLATHIFINLLENAIKYHKPGEIPIIDVSLEPSDRTVVVSIIDNGIGIAPEYHEKIFNIFQRLHSQADYPGTGIGLAAVKKAVQIMGGRVWVESEPGRGSVFKVKVLTAMTA